MPSAANAKSEKPASAEATDNSPIRQIVTVIEHKIRNLEKRKSKLTSYRDLQKAGKELNSDQKVAVAKYDEVVQTLEFARDLSKQVSGIVVSAERDAKKQAKKDAWVRYTADANKIREVLLILDCLTQMGNEEAREDFLNGTNGAAKLTEGDLKILDDLYPEVTPKHEPNEEGQPGFHAHSMKAAEHLYSIIDGKPKEVLGTTYTHIKEIVTAVHESGYFDKLALPEVEAVAEVEVLPEMEPVEASYPPPPAPLPVPPAPAVVPAPAYPLRPMPPLTLQEIEHAYFTQQYQQQRPISEVIGSQNFFFLQESEIDSPTGTPQPPMNQSSPPAPIPTQTFTNQHFVGMSGEALPMPHFPPRAEYPGVPPLHAPLPPHALPAQPPLPPQPAPPAQHSPPQPASPARPADDHKPPSPPNDKNDDEWKENQSPERENGERRTQGQGDGQRFRRYGRGGRGASNGYRGRGPFGGRQAGDYHPRHDAYPRKDYQPRQYDSYQPRPSKDRADNYYGNGETTEPRENGSRDRDGYNSYKGRGRARPAPRAAPRPAPPAARDGPRDAPRAPRQFARKPDKPE